MANATTSSLMRRTKQELVNIILRKDASEEELRTKITLLEKAHSSADSKLTEAIKKLHTTEDKLILERKSNKSLADFKSQYESSIDELTSAYEEKKLETKQWKIVAYVLIGILICSTIYVLSI